MQRIRELRAQGKTPAMVDIGYELFVEYDDDAAAGKNTKSNTGTAST